MSLLALNTRGEILQLPTYCQGVSGCVQTLAVFSPFGSSGIPSFVLEVEPFFIDTLTTLNDSVPAVASMPALQFQDLSYTLTNSSAACTIELSLLSASVSGSPSVQLCVVKNIGAVWLYDNSRADCDWLLLVNSNTQTQLVTFNATSPVVTGALPQYNNVAGTTMAGTYHMLAITFDTGATPSGLNATYSVTQSCVAYPDSVNAPTVSAPIVSAQSISQTIDVSAISYYTLDLTSATIDANTDISILVTGSNVRLPSANSPLITLSYSQSVPLVDPSTSDFSDTQGGLEQQLINLNSYPTLTSAPLYLSIQAQPITPRFGRPSLSGPLTYTITATISQRTTLAANTPVVYSASTGVPIHWFNVLVPTVSGQTSAVFAVAAANTSAMPQMEVLSDPQYDPNFDGDSASYSYVLDYSGLYPIPGYSAGGLIVVNNQPCTPTSAGACRYVVAVYTPSPTDYTLLVTGLQDNGCTRRHRSTHCRHARQWFGGRCGLCLLPVLRSVQRRLGQSQFERVRRQRGPVGWCGKRHRSGVCDQCADRLSTATKRRCSGPVALARSRMSASELRTSHRSAATTPSQSSECRAVPNTRCHSKSSCRCRPQ